MSYSELASHMESLSSTLRQHLGKLEGEKLAKAAQTFAKALATFERAVGGIILGSDPDLEELEKLVASPAKKSLKSPFYKKALRTLYAVDEEKPTNSKLLKYVRLKGKATEALGMVKEEIRKQSIPSKPLPISIAELQEELWRLGGLSDEEFASEAEGRWKLPGLKKLAKANAISLPKKATKTQITKTVREAALRAYTNVRA